MNTLSRAANRLSMSLIASSLILVGGYVAGILTNRDNGHRRNG